MAINEQRFQGEAFAFAFYAIYYFLIRLYYAGKSYFFQLSYDR